MKSLRVILLFTFLTTTFYSEVNGFSRHVDNYENYQIWSIEVKTQAQLKFIKSLTLRDDLDFWKFPKILGDVAQVMVHVEDAKQLKVDLAANQITAQMIVPNVEKVLQQEREANLKAKGKGQGQGPSPFMEWNSYQTWETMVAWIQSLDKLPNGIAKVTVVGASFEKRPIYMVKVSNGPSLTQKPKKAIFIEANIHAREWISSAVATFLINELTTKPTEYADLLDAVDVYINPMSNPDGYAYTHANTNTRLWRKTRSVNPGSTCVGCDPNRNFEFMWGGESTSTDPCTDIYHGPGPWSEPEVRAIRDAMRTIRSGGQEVQAYIGLHACGNVWLLSWGWTEGIYPEDYKDLLAWGNGVVEKIKEVNGTQFETGQGADIFYGVGGASDDYARSSGIKYATTAELRCGDQSGFILPPEQIIPTGLEIMAAIRETGRRIVADDTDDTGTNSGISNANYPLGKYTLMICSALILQDSIM
jgi:hypothetical protein